MNGARRVAALLVVALSLWTVSLWPLPRFAGDSVPCAYMGGESRPLETASGDHLQLIFHFELLGDYLRGDLPWFRNLWEFNTSDEARPRRPDGCYAPFALPYCALRRAGAPAAAAWNACSFLSVLLGTAFCFLLARRCGAGDAGALLAAALAGCVPYRWATIATGSPTGFGMGLVPGIALGVDLAVRDRKAAGGFLAGTLLLLCYAADLHCFLFAALAVPLWFAASLSLAEENPLAKPRLRKLCLAMLPLVAAGVASALAAVAIRRGYSGTNVEVGRTMQDVASHSPAWSALLRPDPDGVLAGHLHVGWLLPLLAAAAFAVFLASCRRNRRARTGILLCLAVLCSFLFALGTNGPCDGIVFRIARFAVPPIRLIRQPVKVLCLLPALSAAIFGLALPLLSNRFGSLRRLSGARGAIAAAAAAALAAATALDARSGTRIGLCRLSGPNAAYEAAAAAARSRGATPRAIVLPISRGDAVTCAAYPYLARQSRLRLLDGYAAVCSDAYVRDVFERYRTMEEGDLTADQLRGLRDCGVTSVLVDEDVLGRISRSFPGGAALRRMLANPRLRLLARDRGVWAFELLPEGESSTPVPFAPTVEPAMRHWRFDPPASGIRAKADCAAEAHREDGGWLVRAEAGRDLRLVSSHRDPDRTLHEAAGFFPADPAAPPGSFRLVWFPAPFPGTNRVVRLASRGDARVSDAMFATAAATGGLRRIAFADLPHRWGETVPDPDGSTLRLRFEPGRAPACLAVSGPFLPLSPVPARLRLAEFRARRLPLGGTGAEGPLPELELVLPDGRRHALRVGDELPCDPTEPVSFEVRFDPADGFALELSELTFENVLR